MCSPQRSTVTEARGPLLPLGKETHTREEIISMATHEGVPEFSVNVTAAVSQ